jgi:hypothetical protein
MPRSLDDVEDSIRRLERELQSSTSDSDPDWADDPIKGPPGGGARPASPDLLPIPPLPSALLPPPGLSKRLRQLPKGPVKCYTCNLALPTTDAYRAHAQSLQHREQATLRAGGAYQAGQGQPNYCRACRTQFASPALLLSHRASVEHKKAQRALDRASYCAACRKQFTSPLQLREHVVGGAHLEQAERRAKRQR